MKLILRRTESTADGVFGKLYIPGSDPLFTAEDDDNHNLRGKSCIPTGTYVLKRTTYHKHGFETFEVTGVPNRQRILIHPGNSEEDTQGCILVGLRQGKRWVPDEDDPTHPMKEKRAVLDSRLAFRRFMVQMAAVDEATLTVEWSSTPTLKAA